MGVLDGRDEAHRNQDRGDGLTLRGRAKEGAEAAYGSPIETRTQPQPVAATQYR